MIMAAQTERMQSIYATINGKRVKVGNEEPFLFFSFPLYFSLFFSEYDITSGVFAR